jgi:hypothetical protein
MHQRPFGYRAIKTLFSIKFNRPGRVFRQTVGVHNQSGNNFNHMDSKWNRPAEYPQQLNLK